MRKPIFFGTAATVLLASYGLSQMFRPSQAVETAAAQPAQPAFEVFPKGHLYEGCRIEWGTKLCGEEAQKGRYYNKPLPKLPGDRSPNPGEPEEDTCYATLTKFRRIETRQARGAVRRIMGCEGDLMSEMRIDHVLYRRYAWRSRDGRGMAQVLFRGDTVEFTQQEGLR